MSVFPSVLETKAELVAKVAHYGQTYGDDIPYMEHLTKVRQTLSFYNYNDENLEVAAWLHDIVEDTNIDIKFIQREFGEQVALLVFAVTNEIGKNRKERNLKTYQKILNYPEAIPLKLADRLVNVEKSMANRHSSRFYDMYKGEYELFRGTLYKEGEHLGMWGQLDRLMEYKTEN